MPLSQFTKDMAIIQKLDDEPNDVGGLTAQELKAKFDEAGEALKDFLNDSLLPQLGANSAAQDLGATLNGENMSVQQALDMLQQASVQAGNVPIGGHTGDVLMKQSDAQFDLLWSPLCSDLPFSADDWTHHSDSQEYTITFSSQQHQRKAEDFACIVRHRVDGLLISNTWAALGTQCAYDPQAETVTLRSPEAFDGAALFCGGQIPTAGNG